MYFMEKVSGKFISRIARAALKGHAIKEFAPMRWIHRSRNDLAN